MLIARFLEQAWAERGLAKASLSSYGADLRGLAGWLVGRGRHLPDADRGVLFDYLAARHAAGMKPRSGARLVSTLKQFYLWTVDQGLRSDDPAAELSTPKLPRSVPKALSERDMEDLLDAESDRDRAPWLDLRDTAVLILLYGAGLRIGEALALTKAEIDELLKSGNDTLAITGKGNKTRMVLLLPQALKALKDYRDACPWLTAAKPGDRVFMGARGGALDPAIVQKRVREIRRSLGLAESVTPHALRHSFAYSWRAE